MIVKSGLFRHTKDATTSYDQEQPRERIGTVLMSAMIQKQGNPETFDLDTSIKTALPDAIISDNIVILDGWAFEIDRDLLEIIQCLGKGEEYKFPTIVSIDKSIAEDGKTATIVVTAEEATNGINKIEIIRNGEVIETIDCEGTTNQVTKTTVSLTENGKYLVKVYSTLSILEICEITELPELTTDRTELKVGDYIDYTPDTASAYSLTSAVSGHDTNQSIPQDTLQWRVMSINEDGSVDLISATPTSTNVYFQGALGYNNCVAVLNDICEEQYSNASLGVTGRSITIEDIENKFSSEGSTAKTTYINNKVASLSSGTSIQSVNTANNTVTYTTSYSQYPDIYQYENGSGINTTTVKTDGIGESEEYSGYTDGITTNTSGNANTSGLTATYTHYAFINTPASYFTDSTFHDLVFGTGQTYWLASRCVYCNLNIASFNLRRVSGAYLSNRDLFLSGGGRGNSGYLVRPIVSLGSNIQISAEGGTAESPRAISL